MTQDNWEALYQQVTGVFGCVFFITEIVRFKGSLSYPVK